MHEFLYIVNVIGQVAGAGFSVVGTIATVIGIIPTFRHKVAKSIAMSLEAGRMEARR